MDNLVVSSTDDSGTRTLFLTSAKLQAFTGTENGYTAEEYISLCEYIMKDDNSLTEDADKISFIRSGLQGGSWASRMMHASAFTKPTQNQDYYTFRTNFLNIFGSGAPHSVVHEMVPDPNIVAAKVFVLPQIREFTGSENDYTAEEYISLCDDVMKTCYITQDTCKISFVRSRLQIGSRPAKMMSTRIFTDPEKNKDYDSFRTKFLRIFGSKKAPHSLVQGIINAVDVFLSDTPSLNMFEGQVEANRLSTEFIQYIKDNGWNEGEYISLQNNHKFMEFFIFMILMRGTCRGSAWSLEYKPTDELHEFVQKLRKNREENGQIGKAVRTVNVTCQYCQRKGHTISRCSLREKDERGSRKAEAADDPRSHTRRGARRNTAYCTFHQCIGHSTDECYSVINLGKKMRKKRGSGGSQPGEAARPIKYSQYRNNSRK